MCINSQMTFGFYCFFLLSGSLCAQSSLENERKRELLNQIKPTHLIHDSNLKSYKQQLLMYEDAKVVNKDNIKEKVAYYRNGGAQFEDKVTIDGLNSSMGYIDLFKMENGSTYKIHVVDGKSHFIKKSATDFIHDNMSQKNRLQGFKIEATIGGLNLSGFREKKTISTKSKNVLIHVLGADVE